MSNTYIPLVLAAALAGLFSAPLLAAPGAHGPDGQHLDAPANTQRDGLARLPDGSVNVPKMAQRRMEIRTQMAMQSEHAQTVQMNGKVDIDPNAGGRVQAPFQGRVEAPGKGFAVLGQAVRKGDVLAYLLPVSDAISLGSQRAELAEVKAQLTLAQQRVARLQALQDEGRLLTAGPNPAIDAEDPSHNDSNQVLDDTVGMVDTHLTKAKSGLVCSPRGPSIGKDDTRGGSEVAPVGLGCFESETEKARSEMT